MTSIFQVIGPMERSLDFHLVRQNMISANVANVDTPGYAPRELVRDEGTEDFAAHLAMAQTEAAHIPASGSNETAGLDVVEEHTVIPGNDNNFVSLDHEMARLAANTIRYEAVSKLVSTQMGMLAYAASNANRG
ncbi:MAG: flagellar basal body rod protein FlgB [Myxococcota bacterium]|jgi:flagellar basal-body rod protein FlgB|nr:flagellar basal body rod protein FlgB [Myxococcota bacterium]